MLLNLAVALTMGQAGEAGPVAVPTVPSAAELTIEIRNDLAKLTPELRLEMRYLRQPPQMDEREWAKLCAVLSGTVNEMSTRGSVKIPTRVGKHLLRVQFSHYGWTAETWEKLRDPYSVADARKVKEIDVQKDFVWWGGVWPEDGKYYPKGAFTFKKWVKETVDAGGGKVVAAMAPWMSLSDDPARYEEAKQAAADVAAWTYSATPSVRADWFIGQSQNIYYGFLGITKQADFEKLVRFRADTAAELERKKVVIFSGVAKGKVRRIERTQTTLGGLWRTFDSEKPVGKKSPLIHLKDDDGFQFEATEQIGVLPNGLPAWFLADNKGTLQQVAPGNIVGGYRRRGIDHNDSELAIRTSCIDCHFMAKHEAGLKDITAASIRKLTAYGDPKDGYKIDYKLIEDLEREYVNATGQRDIPQRIVDDRRAFALAILEATGMATQDYGAAFMEEFSRYEDKRVNLNTVAADVGLTVPELKACFALEERSGYVPADAKAAKKYVEDMREISVITSGGALPIRSYEELFATIQDVRFRNHRRKEK